MTDLALARPKTQRWFILAAATVILAVSFTTVSTAVDLSRGDMRTAEAATASSCTTEGSYRKACVQVTAIRLDPDSWEASVMGWGAASGVYLYVQMIVYDTSKYSIIWDTHPIKLKTDYSGKTYKINTFGDCNFMIQVDGWAWRAGFPAGSYVPVAHKSIKT